MRGFTGIWKKNYADQQQMMYLDPKVLQEALYYAEHLILPESTGKAAAYLTEQKRKNKSEEFTNEKKYCIRILSDGTKAGDLDAGYLAGQIASFLRFQGKAGIRIRRMQEKRKNAVAEAARTDTPWKMCCRAVLSAGEHEHTGKRRKRMLSEMESGVYTEKREKWNEELLAYTKFQYPGTYRKLNVCYQDGWIHFSEKRHGMHLLSDSFEAGMAAAQIMAAAEKLWMELELSLNASCSTAGYLFSVRRKEYSKDEVHAEQCSEKISGKEMEKEAEILYPGKVLAGFGSGIAAGISL